jgi:hypothetical protein
MSASVNALHPSLSTLHAYDQSQFLGGFNLEQYLHDGFQDEPAWQLPPTPSLWDPSDKDTLDNILELENFNPIPPQSYLSAQCQPSNSHAPTDFPDQQSLFADLPQLDMALPLDKDPPSSVTISSPPLSSRPSPSSGYSDVSRDSISQSQNGKCQRAPRKRGRKPKIHDDESSNQRKERNRIAAEKCRAKKRVWVDELVEKVRSLNEENVSLRMAVEILSNDIKVLRSIAREHNLSQELAN